MPPALHKTVFLSLLLSSCYAVPAQRIILVDNTGSFYSFDPSLGHCTPVKMATPVCGFNSPTDYPFSVALYKDTLYFTTMAGSLYRSILGDAASCMLLTTNVHTDAMTVDDNGSLFWVDYSDELIEYDPHLYKSYDLGTVNYSPGGDLIFYEKNLIMASSNRQLINVNLSDPGNSTVFLALPGYSFYGLVNLSSNCGQHTVLGITSPESGLPVKVVEIDMDQRSVLGTTCNLPIQVQDAASSAEYGGYGLSDYIFPSADTVLCKGSELTLDALSPGAAYLWDDNSTNETRTLDLPGKYWVTVSESGCMATDTITCSFITKPVIAWPADTAVCTTDTLVLQADFPYTTYQWQDGSTGSHYTVTQSGLYFVQATDVCGAVADSINILFENCSCKFYVPDAFTPGRGGVNSVFMPKYRCTLHYTVKQYQLKVFNRWGELLYSSNDPSSGWDGSFKNRREPADTYVWELSFHDDQVKTPHRQHGTVLLIR